jgi:hypothetical protein
VIDALRPRPDSGRHDGGLTGRRLSPAWSTERAPTVAR